MDLTYSSEFSSPSDLEMSRDYPPYPPSPYNYAYGGSPLSSGSLSSSSATTLSSPPDFLVGSIDLVSEWDDRSSQCFNDEYASVGNQAYHKSILGGFDEPYMPWQNMPQAFGHCRPVLFQDDTLSAPYQPPLAENMAVPALFLPPLAPTPDIASTPAAASLVCNSFDEDAEGDSEDDGSDKDNAPSQNRKQQVPPSHNTISPLDTPFQGTISLPSESSRPPRAKRHKLSRISQKPQCKRARICRDNSVLKTNPWACPYCPYVQKNKRLPDLKRHIKTHETPEWLCDGCGNKFSRRDALKRHHNNKNNTCSEDMGRRNIQNSHPFCDPTQCTDGHSSPTTKGARRRRMAGTSSC